MWMKNTSTTTEGDDDEYCENLTLAGHADWVMPTLNDFALTMNYANLQLNGFILADSTASPFMGETLTTLFGVSNRYNGANSVLLDETDEFVDYSYFVDIKGVLGYRSSNSNSIGYDIQKRCVRYE